MEENDVIHKLQVEEDNREMISNIEKCISCNEELLSMTASNFSYKYPDIEESDLCLNDLRKYRSHLSSSQNLETICTLHKEIMVGKISTTNVPVRTIHKSSLAQYYIGLCNEEEFDDYRRSINGYTSKQTKMGFNFFKEKLFNKESFHNVSRVYSVLSKDARPTEQISGIKYNPGYITDVLAQIPIMCFFNMSSHSQVYAFDKKLSPKLLETIRSFVDEQPDNFNDEIRDGFPNKTHYINKLLWPPVR